MANRRNTTLKIADAPHADPPADVGEFGLTLMSACFNSISEKDVAEMVSNCVARAKKGNPAAIRFVMDLIGNAAKVAPARIVRPVDALDSAPLLALRRLVARFIEREGPAAPPTLAQLCCVMLPELNAVIECEWFEAPLGGAVKLTPTGRREAGL